ncbi:MAG TPA: aminotransferase class V-fold PLP-dependent enzyme, partial [Pedococcus sp.]|nr:aminotransferase class V-fold PLP-dependent enzyme [Pedococcus sp.]
MSIASTPPSRSSGPSRSHPARRSAPLAQARDHLRAVPPLGATTHPRLPVVVTAGLPVPTTRGVVDYANFDHAASTPALVTVAQAVDSTLRTYSSVHRGNGYASRVTSAWYEQARAQVREFVGAREADEVIFTRNSTDSFSLLAHAIPRDTTVFVFETEHHAALLPWKPRNTVRLPVPGGVEDAQVLLRTALKARRGRHRL